MLRVLLKSILNKITLFCVQTDRDARRLLKLGVAGDKIKVTGNMKFDIKNYADSKKDCTDLKQILGLGDEDKLLVAGSTHPGEEELIVRVYEKLLSRFPGLRLLIAPRHPERAKDVAILVSKFNFQPIRISQVGHRAMSQRAIFILDTIGQLLDYYVLADIVFVGGSLVKKGGHNILEPASLGKPVIFGPHMFNFRDIAELFLNNQAAALAHNVRELENQIKYFLDNPDVVIKISQRAAEIIDNNRGATVRNIDYIKGEVLS